jgi:hypothetical protein
VKKKKQKDFFLWWARASRLGARTGGAAVGFFSSEKERSFNFCTLEQSGVRSIDRRLVL